MPDVSAPGFASHPGYEVEILTSPKRIRTSIAGIVIADSRNALVLRETRHTPVYYIPKEDVRIDEFLSPTNHSTHCPFKGDASYWTFKQGERVEENLVWAYEDPFLECATIKDHMAFYWNRMDVWFEDDEEVFVHARDPKTRIDITRARPPLEVIVDGEVIARSDDYLILYETNLIPRYYLKLEDIVPGVLSSSDRRSKCPYKGEAQYHHVTVGGTQHDDLCWYYPSPLGEVGRIKDHVCFYQERVDAIVIDGERLPTPDNHWADVLSRRTG